MIGREPFMLIIHNIRNREWPDHGERGFEEPEIEAGSYSLFVPAFTCSRTVTELREWHSHVMKR